MIGLNGVWIGWGLGDWSHYPDGRDRDNTVRRFRSYARVMFKRYAGHLKDNNKFDQELYDVVVEMQNRYVADGKLLIGMFIPGVLDLPTQEVCGFRKKAAVIPTKPIIFTVEGHMSNMFFGPCAGGAETLQNQGVCYWKPIGYNSNDLPFDNPSGVRELFNQVGADKIEGPTIDGHTVWWPFPAGTPWGIWGFSQGGMVISEFMETHVLPSNGALHWRLADFKRGIGIGNPRRERGKMAPWNDNPPPADTGGIMDRLFVTTGTALEGRWQENANDKDMFAVNGTDEASKDKTAIAKIVTENSWFGGQASIFARVFALFTNVPAGAVAALKATISAIIFLASNPNPHYSTVTESGDLEWMRGVGQ